MRNLDEMSRELGFLPRPGFAARLLLVLSSTADEHGVCTLSRSEIANMLDRAGERYYHNRRIKRKERLITEMADINDEQEMTDEMLDDGLIDQQEYKIAKRKISERKRALNASPALTSVSRVISDLDRLKLINRWYTDADGRTYDRHGKGRRATYQLTLKARKILGHE